MTVRLRLAALVGVAAAGVACAGAGLATSVLARTQTPSGVVAVDVNPTDSADSLDISSIAYAFPAGTGEVASARPVSAVAARSAALSAARLAAPGVQAAVPSVVDGPMAPAQPFDTIPGCNASNNNCGLPTCTASNPSCSLLNCVASAACNPATPGLGACRPTATGGVLGCGLGANGVNDCFIGLGCGLGGFGLGGCGLFSFSGCGLNGLGLLGPGCTFSGSCPGIGCGFFGGGCGHRDCLGFGFFGFGGDDEDNNHHGCGSFSDFGFRDFHFHGFRNFHFSSFHSGHDSKKH
jgi:hypothetical protein